jgi:hypothetical protein
MPTTIQIVRLPNGKLQPATGPRNKVKPGESVTFTAGAGAQGLVIEFSGASPFGDSPAHRKFTYGVTQTIQKPFDEAPGASNVYVYVCKGAADAAPTNPGDGGEVEVVRG